MVESSDNCAESLLLDYTHGVKCIEDARGRDDECTVAVN